MNTVQQHPDGLVYVRTASQTYVDTPANFTSDFSLTLPALPAGKNERIYDQGMRHTLAGSDAFGAHVSGDVMPWPLGDQAIAGIVAALAKQAIRNPPI